MYVSKFCLFGKEANIDNDILNLCVLTSHGFQNHLGGFPFNLGKLDKLQPDYPSLVDSS